MSWFAQHWLLWVLVTGYTLVLIHHARLGRASSLAEEGLAGYYVGGRKLGGVVVGMSFFATFASTNTYVGNAGKAYEYGAPWLIMVPFMLLFTLLSWTMVAPRLRRFTSHWDALTLPDFLAARFPDHSRGVRMTAACVVVFSSILYLIAIFKGAGNLFEQFLGVPYWGAVMLTLVFVVVYTSVGGFVSVVRTDVVQGILMLIGSVTIFYFVTRAAGGPGVLTDLQADPSTADLFEISGSIPFVLLLGIALGGSLKLLVDPRQISRFYGLKDERSVRIGLWIALGGIFVIMTSLFPIGLYAHFLVEDVVDTDLIVPMLVNDPAVFPIFVSDFLILAILAAAMSSMDSVLLVAASVLYNDLIDVVRPARDPLRWTRAGVVGFAVISAILALNPPGGIVEITVFSGSLYAVCFLPAILFGLHWRRGTAVAVMSSIGLGVPVLVGWLLLGYRSIMHEVFPALAVSVVTYVLVSTFNPPAMRAWPTSR